MSRKPTPYQVKYLCQVYCCTEITLEEPGDPELRHHTKSSGEIGTQMAISDGGPEILVFVSCPFNYSGNESPETPKEREDNQIIEDEEGVEPVDDMALS